MSNHLESTKSYLLMSYNLSIELAKMAVDYKRWKKVLAGNSLLQNEKDIIIHSTVEFSPLFRETLTRAYFSLCRANTSNEPISTSQYELLLDILGYIEQNVERLNTDILLRPLIQGFITQCEMCSDLLKKLPKTP